MRRSAAATLERARGPDGEEELYFDPATGQLQLVPRRAEGRPAPQDAIVATQVAREGFFSAR